MTRRTLLGSLFAAIRPRDRMVVLTFDDSVKSHRAFVAPLLKDLGFHATFFVTQQWMEDREHFMTWQEIGEIYRMGFEIGNHTWTHGNFSTARAAAGLRAELERVEVELARVGVPKPVSFAWPGNAFGRDALRVLQDAGYKLARRGGSPEVEYGKVVAGPYYDPLQHHPLLIPTTGDNYPDGTFENFRNVLATARDGHIAVLQFHGVPDIAHPWVNTPPERFTRYMRYLKDEGYQTLAVRDLEPYIDFAHPPADRLLA